MPATEILFPTYHGTSASLGAAQSLKLWGVTVDALRLASERRGPGLVVTVQGDLDIVTSRQFDDFLTKARRELGNIVLDLAGVDFMDTSSLAVIVSHWKKLTAQGGSLALAGARYRYTKTLWITGLAHRLPLYDTADDAIAALSAGTNSPTNT
jgi:anti-sigma B factor antagonist